MGNTIRVAASGGNESFLKAYFTKPPLLEELRGATFPKPKSVLLNIHRGDC